MPKSDKKELIKCQDHYFSLVPLTHDLHFRELIIHSFCKGKTKPIKKRTSKSSKQNSGQCRCWPVLNQDKNPTSSCFIVPEDQVLFPTVKKTFPQKNKNPEKDHQNAFMQQNEQKSQLLIPKPKSKHSFCNICRNSYDDYLQHIQARYHKVNVRRNYFNQFILDVEAKYDKINMGRNTNAIKLLEAQESVGNSQQSQHDVGQNSYGFKKDQNYQSNFCCFQVPISQFPTITGVTNYTDIFGLPMNNQLNNQQVNLQCWDQEQKLFIVQQQKQPALPNSLKKIPKQTTITSIQQNANNIYQPNLMIGYGYPIIYPYQCYFPCQPLNQQNQCYQYPPISFLTTPNESMLQNINSFGNNFNQLVPVNLQIKMNENQQQFQLINSGQK